MTDNTDRAALRQRIAEALAREDAHNAGYDHGFASGYGADEETDGFVDAVLAVLPAPADRAAEDHRLALSLALGLGTGAPWDAIRDRATELHQLAADRAAVLHEAADELWALANRATERGQGVLWAANELRRMADEEPQS